MIDPPRIEMLPRNQLPILSAGNHLAVLTICHAKPYIEVDTTNDEMEKLNRKPFLRRLGEPDGWARLCLNLGKLSI